MMFSKDPVIVIKVLETITKNQNIPIKELTKQKCFSTLNMEKNTRYTSKDALSEHIEKLLKNCKKLLPKSTKKF